jgi:hypothetical protein
VKRCVTYFSKSNEQLVGEYEVPPVPLARLQALFGLRDDDPLVAEYPIATDQQREFFERLTARNFNSTKFLYYLSNYGSHRGEEVPDRVTKATPLLREAIAEDWPAILRIANEALPNAPDGNAGWLEARKRFGGQRRHYVAEGGGEIVAYGAIEETSDPARRRVFVVMSPGRLKDGLGDAILNQLLHDSGELGAATVWMREQADDALLPFVSERGFVETRRFTVRDGSAYHGVEVVEFELPLAGSS